MSAGGGLLLMWGTEIKDDIDGGYRKLPAGYAPVYHEHNKDRQSQGVEISEGCHVGKTE